MVLHFRLCVRDVMQTSQVFSTITGRVAPSEIPDAHRDPERKVKNAARPVAWEDCPIQHNTNWRIAAFIFSRVHFSFMKSRGISVLRMTAYLSLSETRIDGLLAVQDFLQIGSI